MHSLMSHLHLLKSTSYNCRRLFSTQTTLQSAGSMACPLKTRSVIRFRGPEVIKFLQGLLTNDVRSLENPETSTENIITPNMSVDVTPTVYAAMLTAQGRFLYDFFLYRPPRSNEKLDRTGSGPSSDHHDLEIYADVDKSVVDEVLATLKRYRLRSKVEIENVAEHFTCWQRFGGNIADSEEDSVGWGGTVDRPGSSSSGGDSVGWHWNKDPRLDCIGYRGIFPINTNPPLVEADKETDEGNYLLWRLEKGIAEGSSEIPKGAAIPLEYNLAGLNAISFDKGCYIGQELIARTHHRGVIRKRLIPLRFVTESGEEIVQKVSPGSQVVDENSKKAGMVTTAIGCRGLGIIRLDAAFKEMRFLSIKGQEDVKVETIRPKWWPSEWFLDTSVA